MATCLFRSSLAFRLQSFLETRRAAGREDAATQKILIYLDRFLMSELKPGKPLTREIAEHWFKSMEHLSTGTRINRMSILRQFCLYLSHFDPRTCIVHRSFLPHRTRPAPHIFTGNEVRQIMAASSHWANAELTTFGFLHSVGLLYSTGLRIGEALKLTIGDVDFKRRLIYVREAKFKKSRYVPMSQSAADHLEAYLQRRQRAGFPTSSISPVFVAPAGGRYGKSTVATIFLEIVRKIGIRGPKGQRGPRIHDFRSQIDIITGECESLTDPQTGHCEKLKKAAVI